MRSDEIRYVGLMSLGLGFDMRGARRDMATCCHDDRDN